MRPPSGRRPSPLERDDLVRLRLAPDDRRKRHIDLTRKGKTAPVTYIRDVAHVRDGYSPQTSMVRLDGRRAVLMSVLKTGKASTIDIINSIDQKLPQIRASLPTTLTIKAISDQSVFVRAAISGVIREAVIAGALTGLLILLFLGSWRSTLIITISIPLSILASTTWGSRTAVSTWPTAHPHRRDRAMRTSSSIWHRITDPRPTTYARCA